MSNFDKFIEWIRKYLIGGVSSSPYGIKLEASEDLMEIAELLSKSFPHERLNVKKFHERHLGHHRISFFTDKHTPTQVREILGMESLHLMWSSGRFLHWYADYKEYEKIYNRDSDVTEYANKLRRASKIFKKFEDDEFYHYTIRRYEDSISRVKRALISDIEHNGEISEEVFDKSKIIIEKFAAALRIKVKEKEHLKELEKNAVSQSIESSLDSEIEYMEKFLNESDDGNGVGISKEELLKT